MLIPQNIDFQEIQDPVFFEKEIQVFIKRFDKIHDLVSGNKFFKLKYNLDMAKKEGMGTLLTFGGAFSNHIYAVAAAAEKLGFKSIGLIRGEQHSPLNPTLSFAAARGMQLIYLDRQTYRNKHENSYLKFLEETYGEFYLIPEGGTNSLAIAGTAEMLTEQDRIFSHVTCSIGTGGTFAGLVKSLGENQSLLGFSSLKGDFIYDEMSRLLKKEQIECEGKFEILDKYHFGGYGKFKPDLIKFMKGFYETYQIPLDPVYTGKMMFGIFDLIEKDYFPAGSKILCMHTGGLQGIAGFNSRFKENLPL
ncbi:1-aminocyclopropane-1-carboxylate deaminase/D-cysteine desulfhydrase [Indibacter alkaliphilus]|nr:pyridoxal-phosphate dependent enzyme [Indibacter alkaliphilus]